MDEGATAEEITEGLALAVKCEKEEIKVIQIRPAFGNTGIASVILPKDSSKELVKCGRVKIGRIECRIQLKGEQDRCYRCWSIGHLAARCNGPDRSNCCFKCGEEGRRRAQCGKPIRGENRSADEQSLREGAKTV